MNKDLREYLLACFGAFLGVLAILGLMMAAHMYLNAWCKASAIERLTGRHVAVQYAMYFDSDLLARIAFLPEHADPETIECEACRALLDVFIEQADREE